MAIILTNIKYCYPDQKYDQEYHDQISDTIVDIENIGKILFYTLFRKFVT